MFELSRTSLRIQITLLGSALLFGAPALAHEPVAAPPTSGTAVPLYDNLGDLHYPVDTRHELAQRYFDQGLRLTYAFNHGEALRAFRAAQQHDPQCAMCYWGEAFVLGPNINAPMDADAANPAVAAIRKVMVRRPICRSAGNQKIPRKTGITPTYRPIRVKLQKVALSG